MQRLSDVMSNVNLMLHRRLVPAGYRQTVTAKDLLKLQVLTSLIMHYKDKSVLL